jgi:hypothetical protein
MDLRKMMLITIDVAQVGSQEQLNGENQLFTVVDYNGFIKNQYI